MIGIYLDYQAALRAMFRGSALVCTNGKRTEYAVSPLAARLATPLPNLF
jgi:hypothetical protein